MDLQQSDLERLVFFEHARNAAEAGYAENPLDADVSSTAFVDFGPLFTASWFIRFVVCELTLNLSFVSSESHKVGRNAS